jgi:beta-fructofuranosidase
MPIQLKPDEDYDRDGVFTGCFGPLTDSMQLTIFYSSIRKLPFHWSRPPYPRDAAGLAMATSEDGGQTWTKLPENPILVGEPEGVDVTGFRDPYFADWPALDRVRGEHALYGTVSGGIEGSGPTVFVYAIQPDDLTRWKYLGPLVDLPVGFQPSKNWSGNFGVNWECTNFMTLETGSTSRNFLIIGAEGSVEKDHVKGHKLPPTVPPRTVRGQLWMSGELERYEHGVRFTYKQGGILDHGSYYAANSFLDPTSGRRIVFGWIPEEDITIDHAREKGWNGALAIPREVFLLSIPSTTGSLHTPLSDISNIEIEEHADGTSILHTLGVRPIVEMSRLRETCLGNYAIQRTSLPTAISGQQHLASTLHCAWELEAIVSITPKCETVGFHVRHAHDLSTRTTIAFSPAKETITVFRDASTLDPNINVCPEQGPFTLFKNNIAGREELETLHLRVFSDGDILEIFANDRFALATMVYSEDHERNGGITAFATGGMGSATFEATTVWDGLNSMRSLIVDLEES